MSNKEIEEIYIKYYKMRNSHLKNPKSPDAPFPSFPSYEDTISMILLPTDKRKIPWPNIRKFKLDNSKFTTWGDWHKSWWNGLNRKAGEMIQECFSYKPKIY